MKIRAEMKGSTSGPGSGPGPGPGPGLGPGPGPVYGSFYNSIAGDNDNNDNNSNDNNNNNRSPKTFVWRDFNMNERNDYENEFPWFWIDMETTGLDTDTNLILEIVMVVTDRDLNEVDFMRLVLHHPHSILMARSSAWCRKKFCHRGDGGNGLFEACHFSALSH